MHTDSTHSDSNVPGHHNSAHHAPSAAAMEDRYASNERVWSGDPNAALLNAVAGMGAGCCEPAHRVGYRLRRRRGCRVVGAAGLAGHGH